MTHSHHDKRASARIPRVARLIAIPIAASILPEECGSVNCFREFCSLPVDVNAVPRVQLTLQFHGCIRGGIPAASQEGGSRSVREKLGAAPNSDVIWPFRN